MDKYNRSNFWKVLGIILAILSGIGLICYMLRGVILTPGVAPGSDVTSFAHTAKYIVDYYLVNHRLPNIDQSWYAGFELFHAPPLINYILGIIYFFTKNIDVTTRIYHILGLSAVFLSMFWLMKKEKHPTPNALLASLIFVFMPTILLTTHSYTKLAALFFFPFAFYFTNKVLVEAKIKYIAYLAISIGIMVYAHPMMAESFGMMLIFYAIIYSILDKKIESRRFFIVILGVIIGYLLGAKYLIPFLFERAGITTVSPEEAILDVTNFRDAYLGFGGYIILFLPFIPLYVLSARKNPKYTAMYLTGIVAVLILLGYIGFHLGSFFPFNQAYYYIWYFTFTFLISYLLGLLINFSNIKKMGIFFTKIVLAAFLFLVIISLNNHPNNYLVLFKTNEDPNWFAPERQVSDAINANPNPGRIYMSHYPFGYIKWFLALYTNKLNIEGHYYGLARINKQIAHISDGIHYQYPDYVINKLKKYNTRFFIVNDILQRLEVSNGDEIGKKFIKLLPSYGYKFIDQYLYPEKTGNYLYYNDKPSSYLVPMDEKVLIIGKYSSTLAMSISSGIPSVEGGSNYLDDYNPEFLNNFDTLILYGFGFHNREKAEKIAKDYVNSGGNLVAELFGMEVNPLADNPRFLGVSGFPIKINDSISLKGVDKSIVNYPSMFTLPSEIYDTGEIVLPLSPLKEWNALEYYGLDESLVQSTTGDQYSILGYKNIGSNKVTFVGMNFFYHAFLTHDENELTFIKSLIKTNDTQKSVKESQGFFTTNETIGADKMSFNIQNDRDRYVYLSFAYSPHWKAYLDNYEINIMTLEDLMAIKIPAGSHILEVKYQSTRVITFAWVITILTIVLLTFMIIFSNYFNKKRSKIHNKKF